VIFGGGRLRDNGRTDDRRIELKFSCCYYARTGHHCDSETIEAIGYKFGGESEGPDNRDFDWHRQQWRKTGTYAFSGFYVARESAWLNSLAERYRSDSRHYVVDGREGYVELIAKGFKWREWLWAGGNRDDAVNTGPVIAEGEGIA